MKLSSIYQSILLFGAIASASPVERRADNQWTLRAITGKGISPRISSNVEVVDGAVVIGANANDKSAPFISYIDPNPKGQLHEADKKGIGYLTPSKDSDASDLYDFMFGGVPRMANIKYTNFFATGAGCGSHCGGPMLVYDETPDDDQFGGNWLAAPREEGGYTIRWFNGEVDKIPEGHVIVYLMRDSA